MSRIINDIVGNTLAVSQHLNPTVTLTTTVIVDIGTGTFVQSSPPFTLTLTRTGNIVFMDWTECRGTVTGTVIGLRTSVPIPINFVPPAANVGDGFFIRPGMTTSLVPYGNPDSGVGVAAEPYLGFQGAPYYLFFGVNSSSTISTAAGAFILYAGSTCYHV